MRIEQRLSKLEQRERDLTMSGRRPGVDPETMADLLRVGSVVSTPVELERHLESREASAAGSVVSLDDKRTKDAVRAAFARSLFDQARSNAP